MPPDATSIENTVEKSKIPSNDLNIRRLSDLNFRGVREWLSGVGFGAVSCYRGVFLVPLSVISGVENSLSNS